MGLSENGNVYPTALRILRARGFKLWVTGRLDSSECIDPGSVLWFGEKDGFELYAHNPVSLLGLAAIHAHVEPSKDEPYWWSVDGPDISAELYEKAFPDEGDLADGLEAWAREDLEAARAAFVRASEKPDAHPNAQTCLDWVREELGEFNDP